MEDDTVSGKVIAINGPVVKATGLRGIRMFDVAEVGPDGLIGEVIRLSGDTTIIQVYEDNTGMRPGCEVISHCRPLSVLLGPGLIANIYDGIQRPLIGISEVCGSYIRQGLKLSPLDADKKWEFQPLAEAGAEVTEGSILGEIRESPLVVHRVLLPPGNSGKLTSIADAGQYTIEDEIFTVATRGGIQRGKLASYWPVRRPRPGRARKKPHVPLITGQRIIDTFFPIARGGAAAIPGGFGTGKTMTQHALAKWCNADIIVYIGCGERGNEMTDVLTEFPRLIDERHARPLIERTVMIANTSNMPVPAREVSIYTGVTIAEYYRDMGYSVAVLADSTSRWAEALRELSSRLGDMPAEEGFPPYLGTRLAEFYERAGLVETLSGRDGDITIIGAVSPPGGDFSEPVTQHTSRFVRCFWALDKTLSDARHYPSISWIDSYTEYLSDIEDWWKNLDDNWLKTRNEVMNILLEDHRLEQLVKLVGSDALPASEQYILFCAEMIKNGFLQQNSFDPEDKFCSPEKQLKLLHCLVHLYKKGMELVHAGLSVKEIASLNVVSEIVRLKSEIPNREVEKIDAYIDRLDQRLAALKTPPKGP
ncbi:MAG: V-type ATP synthase subunit A [Syntrophobacteraceae bacterium]